MKIVKRVLLGVVFLLSVGVLLLSLAVGVGVWVVKGPVAARLTYVFERVESALDVADRGLAQARTSLDNAASRLEGVKQEQRKISQEPPSKLRATGRILARTVQQVLAPDIDVARDRLRTVAEASVVVNSVLEDLGNIPQLSASGLDVDQLETIHGRLSDVTSSAWELSRLLGELDSGDAAATSAAADRQLSRVEEALKAMRSLVTEYEPRLARVREQTQQLKAFTLGWITPGAILISFLSFWVALSQVSLLAHVREGWKRVGQQQQQQ